MTSKVRGRIAAIVFVVISASLGWVVYRSIFPPPYEALCILELNEFVPDEWEQSAQFKFASMFGGLNAAVRRHAGNIKICVDAPRFDPSREKPRRTRRTVEVRVKHADPLKACSLANNIASKFESEINDAFKEQRRLEFKRKMEHAQADESSRRKKLTEETMLGYDWDFFRPVMIWSAATPPDPVESSFARLHSKVAAWMKSSF